MFIGQTSMNLDNKNLEQTWMAETCFKDPEYSKPRMFTMNQIKDLFYLHLSRSSLKRQFSKNDHLLKYHDDQIFDQGRAHKRFTNETKEEFDTVYKNVEELGNYVSKCNKISDHQFKDLFRFEKIADKKLNSLKQNDDDFKVFQDMINGKAERLGTLYHFISYYDQIVLVKNNNFVCVDNRIIGFKKIVEEKVDDEVKNMNTVLNTTKSQMGEKMSTLEKHVNKTKEICLEIIGKLYSLSKIY